MNQSCHDSSDSTRDTDSRGIPLESPEISRDLSKIPLSLSAELCPRIKKERRAHSIPILFKVHLYKNDTFLVNRIESSIRCQHSRRRVLVPVCYTLPPCQGWATHTTAISQAHLLHGRHLIIRLVEIPRRQRRRDSSDASLAYQHAHAHSQTAQRKNTAKNVMELGQQSVMSVMEGEE